MAFFDMPRVPEPEVMDDSAEVEAYSSAAAHAYLDTIDDTLVEHALRLVKRRERERGRALDIGTGPGQIVIKLAKRLPEWKFTGVDRSLAMIAQAQANLASAGGKLAGRAEFQVADGNRLPFPDGSFDLVMCNSVLHHLAEPEKLLSEMSRLVNSGGAILLRDLRRPARFAYPLHVRWHGRHYSGVMYQLYCDSVRSAYTVPELKRMLDSAALPRAHVFEHRSTHIGLERPIAS
jgi:ubiquinone/menaquinone biosynthesis C-methylase UbiE